jgi:hypothetical protein
VRSYAVVLALRLPPSWPVGIGDHWVTGGAPVIFTVATWGIARAAQRTGSDAGAHQALTTIAPILRWMTL